MDVLDSATLQTLRSLQDEGDDDLLVELIDLFLDDAPTRLAAVRDAVQRGDWSDLAAAAHGLKGSCGSLGALGMADVCARLEQHGRHGGQQPAAEAMYRELERHYTLVCEALRRERANPTH